MTTPAWLDRDEFPWTPRRLDVGDGALSFIDEGRGPTLLFSHGTPTWSYDWRHLVRALAATHRCVAVDHLGFGLSERPRGADYRPEAHAARFGRAIERLGLDRFTLFAHDFGGPFALDAALTRPERLDGVVLFNTFCWPFTDDPRARRVAWLAGTGLWRWLYRHANLSLRVIATSAWGDAPRPAALWAQYLPVFEDKDAREDVLWALAKAMRGSTDFYRSLWERRAALAKVPMLLVWGLKDAAFTPAALARCREAWPHATVREVPTAGHWPHEEQPALVLDAVQAFLRRT